MRQFLPPATRFATALAAAGLVAFGGSEAAAQDDPFALPRDVTIATARQAEGPGLTPVYIDGRELPRMVPLKWDGGVLLIDAAAAQAAGLPIEQRTTGWIALESLRLASFDFDHLAHKLTIKLFRRGDGTNNIDYTNARRQQGERADMTALLIDYDLTASATSSGASAGAFILPRVVSGDFQLSGGFQLTSQTQPGAANAVRLDTTVQFDLPGSTLSMKAGDFISVGSATQRPLRLGGIQIASDFALRPDLVTTPLPSFSGSVAVPTGIDLIVNDQRLGSRDVEAGDFQLHNIPVSNGRGSYSVIVRDALGRETITTAQAYVSSDMLAPGLWRYGANVGWIRRRYGQTSMDYGELAGSFLVRRGLAKGLSLGVSGEFGSGVTNLGAEVQATIAGVAMAFTEVRFSHLGGKSGLLLRAGVESAGQGFSARVETALPSPNYRDIAMAAGDAAPERQLNALTSFDLRQTVRFQVTASRRWRAPDPRFPTAEPRFDLLRATFRGRMTDQIDTFADLTYRASPATTSIAAMVGIAVRLGGKVSGQAAVTRRNGAYRGQATVSRPDVVPGDIGYAVAGTVGQDRRLAGAVAWRSRFTRVQADAEITAGRVVGRVNARGTLVFAGRQVFARNQTGGAYALVSTGRVGGVTVTRENAPAGVTNRNGMLLVENVTALVPVQFDVDADTLPAEAVAQGTYRRVVTSRGGVARVKLGVTAFRSLPLRLTGPSGAPLPLGLVLKGRETGTLYRVGYDGLIDFNALSGDSALSAADGSWQGCQMDLPQDVAAAMDQLDLRTSCAAQLLVTRER